MGDYLVVRKDVMKVDRMVGWWVERREERRVVWLVETMVVMRE